MADILSQLQGIKVQLAEYSSTSLDPTSRRHALALVKGIAVDLEDPGDLVDRIVYQQAENALVRIAVDVGLFEILTDSTSPVNAETLAKRTNTDVALLERVLRGLAAMYAVEEIGVSGYGPTNISRAFATAKGVSMARVFGDVLHPIWNKLPQALAETKYRNPTDVTQTGTQLAFKTDEPFFQFLAKKPDTLRDFGTFMSTQRVGRPNFLDIYPAEEQLARDFVSNYNKDEVMLIDVGGARGGELLEFKRRLPDVPGRLILQDRPEAVELVQENDSFEAVAYDFFTPQPVRGARAYYFRNIFHDWSDSFCLRILQSTVSAMAPGYSKLLINEIVMPQRGANLYATNSDVNMMAVVAGVERTEQQWKDLLSAVGLKIAKIWTPERESESIIEAVLAEE